MNMESSALKTESEGRHLSSLEAIYQDRQMYNDLQRSKLIPLAYSLRHPKEPLPEDRNSIAREWINEGDAQKIEEYMRSHPQEKIDTENTAQLEDFLLRMDPSIKERLSPQEDSEIISMFH